MNLRPDEAAAQYQINKNQRRDQNIKSGIKSAGMATATAIAGGLSAKILPFLSEFIPADLAIKGINKVAPNVGDFLKKGMNQGLDLKSGLNFLKENISGKSQENPKTETNVIEQYSPELFQFLKQEIESGRSPIEAGAIAQTKNEFKKVIKKMSEDHKANFSAILETIFGSPEQPQKTQGNQQPGGIDPQLLSIMQSMQDTMNKFRGG